MEGKDKKEIVETAEKLAGDFFSLLDVDVGVMVGWEEGLIKIDIKTDEPGVLIGYRGETLRSLQLVLSIILCRKVGEWMRVLVDVEGYREARSEKLRQMAKGYADRVKETSEEVVMPYLSGFERRVIHMFLADDSGVETESTGEGSERKLVIRPAKLSGA